MTESNDMPDRIYTFKNSLNSDVTGFWYSEPEAGVPNGEIYIKAPVWQKATPDNLPSYKGSQPTWIVLIKWNNGIIETLQWNSVSSFLKLDNGDFHYIEEWAYIIVPEGSE